MDLFAAITEIYPELTTADFLDDGAIRLKDDGDGVQYIAKWEYSKPIPAGLKVGKQHNPPRLFPALWIGQGRSLQT